MFLLPYPIPTPCTRRKSDGKRWDNAKRIHFPPLYVSCVSLTPYPLFYYHASSIAFRHLRWRWREVAGRRPHWLHLKSTANYRRRKPCVGDRLDTVTLTNTNCWGRFLYVWLDCWRCLFQICVRGRYVFHTVSSTQALLLKKAHYNWTVCSEWWWLELRGADSISRWWHLEKMSWFEASSVMINQAHQSQGGIKSWLIFFSWLLTAVALVVWRMMASWKQAFDVLLFIIVDDTVH